MGSASYTGLETDFVIAQRWGFLANHTLSQAAGRIEHVGRIITGLRQSLEFVGQ